MTDSGSDDLILVGVIGRAHGIRGEVKVVPETDDPHRFRGFQSLVLRSGRGDRVVKVVGVRIQTSGRGETPILHLEDVETREAAEALRGTQVLVKTSELPLAEDEFFLHDLVGADVVTVEGESIGVVRDVVDLPGAATMVVRRTEASDVMVPLVPEFVHRVEEGRIVVHLIEGMLDA